MLNAAAGFIISASSHYFSEQVLTAYTLVNFAKKEGEIMSNLEATENKNQVKWDLAGPMLELLQYNIAVSNDLGSLLVETSEGADEKIHGYY